MEKNVYRIYFNLPYNCGALNSLAYDCHTSVLGFNEKEALDYFYENIQVCGVHVKNGIRITKIELYDF